MNQETLGTVNLSAPAFSLSQNPEAQERPYSEYDIIVTAPNHRDVIIEGVQILPDVVAQQDVFMHTNMQRQSPEIIHIADNTLWGNFPPKIPEAEVKPLPPATGFVVLPEVVIPEFIIVHAGRPDNRYAPNFWVPFTDYIKNVASSEIYATWPTETLIANILAIISFTLNRVFTEWYRSRGFNFTITNSTQFDQAFIYGRNIFDTISVIVDDIFNTYITRPGIRQPLFAQYNDGRRVNNPGWLSQWGSQALGLRGYDHLSILRYYYGQDIYLDTAEKVEGIPMSYPGTALQVGSTGDDVIRIQEQLNTIANNFPAIPRLVVDGIYGEQTRNSVTTFQRVFNMPQTGIVGFNTWYKIARIYVSVARLAEL